MSAAGPSQGRLHERGGSQARSARPLVLAAADTPTERAAPPSNEAAHRSPSVGSAAAYAASEGVQQ